MVLFFSVVVSGVRSMRGCLTVPEYKAVSGPPARCCEWGFVQIDTKTCLNKYKKYYSQVVQFSQVFINNIQWDLLNEHVCKHVYSIYGTPGS